MNVSIARDTAGVALQPSIPSFLHRVVFHLSLPPSQASALLPAAAGGCLARYLRRRGGNKYQRRFEA